MTESRTINITKEGGVPVGEVVAHRTHRSTKGLIDYLKRFERDFGNYMSNKEVFSLVVYFFPKLRPVEPLTKNSSKILI